MKNDIDAVLEQRGSIYGGYESGCHLRGNILELLEAEYSKNHAGKIMPDIDRQHLWDIVNKLIRLAVSPKHIDSWVDIQGYAKLTETAIREAEDANL